MVDQLIAEVNTEQAASVQHAKERIGSSVRLLIITNVVVILIGVLLTLFVSRIINRHLKKVVEITTEVANGNLAVESMDYEGKDEIGQLAAAVNQMKNSIRDILFKVTDASKSVRLEVRG